MDHTLNPQFDDRDNSDDPTGEQEFDEAGFLDDASGGPLLGDPDLADDAPNRPQGRLPQKMAGLAEEAQHQPNTSDLTRPDSEGVVLHLRGGDDKGDPDVGGTRTD